MSREQYKQSVVLIGAGGLAWGIGHAFRKAGVLIKQVVSPSPGKGVLLARELSCDHVTSISKVDLTANLYFLAVPDRAIGPVSEELALHLPSSALVAHCSGSVSIKMLCRHKNAAVFYPFQTFTRGRLTNLSNVAIFIEASNKRSQKLISSLVAIIGGRVYSATSEQRPYIHLAGVIGNNFTNYLIGQSVDFLQQQGFSREILHPLILETVSKAFELSPDKAQTGPAIRNDVAVMDKHQELLQSMPQLQQLYVIISKLIAQKRMGNKQDNVIDSYE